MRESHKRWRTAANWITGSRIVFALALIVCPTFSGWFYLFYILGGISDVLDGIAARHSGTATKFGAQFDTAADVVFVGVTVIKVVRAVTLPGWMLLWVAGIAVIKCANIVSGFLLRKRFVSEHTAMNKICGALVFSVPLCMGRFPWQPTAAWLVLTCAAATFAALQEGYCVWTGKESEE